jgi:hypothetical protein
VGVHDHWDAGRRFDRPDVSLNLVEMIWRVAGFIEIHIHIRYCEGESGMHVRYMKKVREEEKERSRCGADGFTRKK